MGDTIKVPVSVPKKVKEENKSSLTSVVSPEVKEVKEVKEIKEIPKKEDKKPLTRAELLAIKAKNNKIEYEKKVSNLKKLKEKETNIKIDQMYDRLNKRGIGKTNTFKTIDKVIETTFISLDKEILNPVKKPTIRSNPKIIKLN